MKIRFRSNAPGKASRERLPCVSVIIPAYDNVHDQTELGYDLKCQGHCVKVFEVKGMAQPRDVTLEESQVNAAQQKKKEHILVCIYNLPAHPDKVGCKEIPNPQNIWNPVEKAKVPKER